MKNAKSVEDITRDVGSSIAVPHSEKKTGTVIIIR